MHFAGSNFNCHTAHTGVAVHQQIYHEKFVKEADFLFDTLLIQRLQNHVTGAVGGFATAHHQPFAKIGGVPTKAALVNASIGRAIKGQAHVFEFDDGVNGIFRQNFGTVLVGKVIATFDGVEHVKFPRVAIAHVVECGGNASLRGTSVRAGGVELGNNGCVTAFAGMECRHQTGTACAHNYCVKLMKFSHNRA